jgi:hypothetical protein
MRTQYIVDSLLRGGPNRYTSTLKLHDQLGTQWPELYVKLQDIDSKLAIARTGNKNGHRGGAAVHAVVDGGDDDEENPDDVYLNNLVNASRPKGKKAFRGKGKGAIGKFVAPPDAPKCATCGKPGHPAERCWKNQTCKKCGGKGHVAFNCTKKAVVAAVQAEPNKVQLANVFAQKIPKPSPKNG